MFLFRLLMFLVCGLTMQAKEPYRWALSLRNRGAADRFVSPAAMPQVLDTQTGQWLEFADAGARAKDSLAKGESWLLYLHGFAASAASSRTRADQLVKGMPGNVHLLILDWPSGSLPKSLGGLRQGYIRAAYERAGEAGGRFAPLLQTLFWGEAEPGTWKGEVNLVAHSMGGEVTRTLLENLPSGLREVVLVAPCTDTAAFAASYLQFKNRILRLTVYGATVDKVLPSGRRATEGQILGTFNRQYQFEGQGSAIDVINVTCEYTNWTNFKSQDHYPAGCDFKQDIAGVLAHQLVAERTRLTNACFSYRTPLEDLLYHHHFLHLGDWPPCPKTGPEERVQALTAEGACPHSAGNRP